MRAIRGAICTADNTRDTIYGATQTLLAEIIRRNELAVEDVIAAFFTMTPDLNADFPAYAARDMGWTEVAMLGAQESKVAGAPERSIRTLVLATGERPPRHVYLGKAAAMRPDLAEPGDENWTTEPTSSATLGAGEGRMGTLLVIGLGLIGGSLAGAARRSGAFEAVRGYDQDPKAGELAVRRSLVDDAGDELLAELRAADVVVLAVPVAEILELIPRIGRAVRSGTLVTDVGSTKRRIVNAMDALPSTIRAVGGHPMTGGTASGGAVATPGLFRGAKWALSVSKRTDGPSLQQAEQLVRAAGAHPVVIDADLHDRVVAVTSHLPALMAVGLVELAGQLSGELQREVFLAGPGLMSATRLAAGDPAMTAQMLSDNADRVSEAIDLLIDRLDVLRAEVSGDPSSLMEKLTAASAMRGELVEMAGLNR